MAAQTGITDNDLDQFYNAYKDNNLQGWEQIYQKPELTIWRQPWEGTQLYRYRSLGTLKGIDPETFFKVSTDDQYRLSWDKYAIEITKLQSGVGGHTDAIYWSVKFPWPMTNRDYVFLRRSETKSYGGEEVRFVVSQGTVLEKTPEKSGFIRVETLSSRMLILNDEDGCKYFLLYEDDLKGSVPSTIVNWAVSTAVPAFINNLKNACAGYDDFVKSKKK
eukprot:TRINITY_DN4624_c0_g1_i1.p1 TRINITY_DN4624_c0_g1~~TRINITY_DN4624_c0_g1_i1.p1  ORF type:complete len:219 (-),score=29.71 TRINITY_DN4624_c0_g1_i1:21-677(-)